jgi:hypothetical protein
MMTVLPLCAIETNGGLAHDRFQCCAGACEAGA